MNLEGQALRKDNHLSWAGQRDRPFRHKIASNRAAWRRLKPAATDITFRRHLGMGPGVRAGRAAGGAGRIHRCVRRSLRFNFLETSEWARQAVPLRLPQNLQGPPSVLCPQKIKESFQRREDQRCGSPGDREPIRQITK
jgi:hypothetical protein